MIVPEWLQEHSDGLFDIQKRAINLGAVSKKRVTKFQSDLYMGCVSGTLACFYLNIPRLRENSYMFCTHVLFLSLY
jgi:hypothetical protein